MLWNKEYSPTGYNQGYPVFWDKAHPLATTDGRVFMHRHVASLKLGRWLSSDEEVHHVDGDKLNYSSSNLEVYSKSEHAKIHHITHMPKALCGFCNIEFQTTKDKTIYCCLVCKNKGSVKNPDIDPIILQEMIDSKVSWRKIGAHFGYSDNGIKKRAINLGCILPH